MLTDNHKGFTIVYNHLNLPVTFTKGTNVITITYAADGTKLTKTVTGGTTKNYVSGIEYAGINVEAIYHAEGRLTPNGSNFYYEYSLKDHLGNARVNFRANGTAITHLEAMDYYPFGMLMEGMGATSPSNDYAYNGKELNEDLGLNLSDYGARWYDAAAGRWWGVDPLAEKYSGWSGYNYVMGNPVGLVDPDGMRVTDPLYYSSSQYSADQAKKGRKVEKEDNSWPPAEGVAGQKHSDGDGNFTHNGTGWVDDNGGGYILNEFIVDGKVKPQPFPNMDMVAGMSSANALSGVVLTTVGILYYDAKAGRYLGNGSAGFKYYHIAKRPNGASGSKALAKGFSDAANSGSRKLGLIGYGFVMYDYANKWHVAEGYPGHMKTFETAAEGTVNYAGLKFGIYGAAAVVGWELGRIITQDPVYQDFRDYKLLNISQYGGRDGLLSTDR